MSKQGWREFLDAGDVEDWVVLHGGATVVFRVPSLGEAVELARAVAQVPGLEHSGVMLTIADHHLAVRLTRHFSQLERHHLDLARAITAVAQAHDAVPDRAAAQEVSTRDRCEARLDRQWVLARCARYTGVADVSAVDPLGHGSSVWMQELDAAKPLRHAMHVDVSVAREHVEARLAAALDAGGRIVDDSEAPEQWTLADSAGNRVCICAWKPTAATLPYQWYAGGKAITQATHRRLALTAKYVGKRLSVRIKAKATSYDQAVVWTRPTARIQP